MKIILLTLALISSIFATNIIEYQGDFYSYRVLCYNDDAKIEIYKIEEIAFNNRTLFEDKQAMIPGYEDCTSNPKNIKTKKYKNDDIFKIISENSDFWED